MEKFNVIAVDPGCPLTMAFIHHDGRYFYFAEADMVALNLKGNKWENDPILTANKIKLWIEWSLLPVKAVVEKVNPMPGEGLVSACKFVGSMHLVMGIFAALEIPVKQVAPVKWKRDLGLKRARDSNLKEVSRQRAIQAFPSSSHIFSRKGDHNRAEAGLLGLWLLRHGDKS